MKDTVLFIVSQIVDHPEEVTVDETNNQDKTLLTIHVNPEDMGKVIGKQGRIIRSIRDITKLMAAKQNAYVDVMLAE